MAITSEIIGKLGGAEVESFPVEGTASGSSDSVKVLATIEVPAGETWLVSVVGHMTNNSSTVSNRAQIEIGNSISVCDGYSGAAATVSETVTIRMRRNRAMGSDSFTGHVYTVKM